METLFPLTHESAQKELLPAGTHCLYDHVQIDSDVEQRFVEERLKPDPDVLLYFKFPPKFKLKFPKAIGNYNSNWGIVRRSPGGQPVLQLVRETKGNIDIQKLRFVSETRKIMVAYRYFDALGIDYRPITDATTDWWQPAPATQTTLSGG